MKHLVIVESPTKARTIGKFLGKDYVIKYSMGHIIDLPKSKLGVAIEDKFAPQYEVVNDKKKIISELVAAAKGVDAVILATDPDREGEAIAKNLMDVLSEKKKMKKERFRRIVFHEITEGAIKEAFASPREVDENLVAAQTARRVLDRLVGYQLSPILWRKVRRGLSAGRVQSVAVRLIVEREREIEKFASVSYWSIHSLFDGVEFNLIEIGGRKIESSEIFTLYDGEYKVSKTLIDTQARADEVLEDLRRFEYVVSDVSTRSLKRSPYPPFTTSTLQQQAATRLGFPGKRTMSLAQKLYEEGFITYHRTDSVSLSSTAIKQMRDFIKMEYGGDYLPEKPRMYFTKQKNAQEAHEGIRPTKMDKSAAAVKVELGEAYAKLYDLIWRRAVASQMEDARIESTSVFVESISHPGEATTSRGSHGEDSIASLQNDKVMYRFKSTGSVLLFDGFLRLTPQALEDRRLPKFVEGVQVELRGQRAEAHETAPPPRYNDASLIKTLEEKSIGRPSTYATIVSTIGDRGYVERVERRFIPTVVGIAVNDFLVSNFSTIDDVPFTALMEDELDQIANGRKEWTAMMGEFYDPFSKKLKEAGDVERVKIPVEETGEICPECRTGKLVIRTGKFGKFFSCSRFPECRFTKQFVEATEFLCPKDGGRVVVKKTRKGRKFYGCVNYPNCDFAVWKLTDIKK
jgi:DNA topoisomerase-1